MTLDVRDDETIKPRPPTMPAESEKGAWMGMVWALLAFLAIGALLAFVKTIGNHP